MAVASAWAYRGAYTQGPVCPKRTRKLARHAGVQGVIADPDPVRNCPCHLVVLPRHVEGDGQGSRLPAHRACRSGEIRQTAACRFGHRGRRHDDAGVLRRPICVEDSIRPWLEQTEASGARFIQLSRYDELYGFAWWIFARVLGYAVIPFPVWKLLFPKDSLLDLGLRGRGFGQHVWIYGLCLVVVIPTMLLVANQPDFGAYYPFYKQCHRSWFDFMAWEAMYYVQFFALELFFRGFVVGALRRSMGSISIFVMTLPYCMIHYGKPYLEANGAIVAGIVLGSLAARTKSIYAGFLVHVTVAASMDILALWHRHAIPTQMWPGG